MNKKTSDEIIAILKNIIVNPKPELDFNNIYELSIAVILSAQTTDKKVNIITKNLFKKYPDFKDLKDAKIDDVIKIIKPLGLANNKAKNIINLSKIITEEYNGIMPGNFDILVTLPGIGRKTASVILALGFNIPAMPVDTHLYRMALRLGYIDSGDVIKAEEAYKKYIDKDEWILAHHLFLLFGRYYCKAANPKCSNCELKKYCRYIKKIKHINTK